MVRTRASLVSPKVVKTSPRFKPATMKASTLGLNNRSKAPDGKRLRLPLSPGLHVQSKAKSALPTKGKRLLPSESAFVPGWRQRKEAERVTHLQAEQDASSDEELAEHGSQDGSDDEDIWDTDLTLIGGLPGFESDGDNDEKQHEMLLDSLKGPFAALSLELKEDLVAVICPTTEKIKHANVLITKLDGQTSAALAAFHMETDNIQADASKQAVALQAVMRESQATLKTKLKELEAQYEAREKDRVALKNALKNLHAGLMEEFDLLAEEFQEEASRWETKSKNISKSQLTQGDMKKMLAKFSPGEE